MQLRETADGGLAVIILEGEIDLHQSPLLRAALQGHVRSATPALVLDLSAVTYVDSSGLATIVEYLRSAHQFGGRIALAGLGARVRTIFDLVRFGELLPIVPTLAEARAALSTPPAP